MIQDLTCPIELWHFQFASEQDPLVRLRLFNLSDAEVQSVMAEFTLYDKAGNKLSRQLERAQGLAGKPGEVFEAAFDVEDAVRAHHMDFVIKKVWRQGQSLWRHDEKNEVQYRDNVLPPGEAQQELKALAGEDAVGFPSDQGHVWLCVCGRPNLEKEGACVRCGRDKHEVFTLYHQAAVQEILLEKQAQREKEERERQQEEEERARLRLEKQRKRRKVQRLALSVLGVCLFLAFGYMAVTRVGVPMYRYHQAEGHLQLGEWEQALSGFEALGDYRDARDRVKEARYRMAEDTMRQGSVQAVLSAKEQFLALGDWGEASAMAQAAQQKLMDLAVARHDYAGALELLSPIAHLPDMAGKDKDVQYQWAEHLFETLSFEKAREKYLALGDYRDAASKAYQAVVTPYHLAVEDKDYERAAALLMLLPEEDSLRGRLSEMYYLWAEQLFESKMWQQAGEKYVLAGDYRDAWRKAIQCLYEPAVDMLKNGQYAEAKAGFDKIIDYEDAREKSKQASYYLGKAALDKGDLDEAIGHFEDAGDLALARDALIDSHYQKAKVLWDAKEGEKALQHMEQAGEYLDAKPLSLSWRYDLGQQALEAGDYDAAVEHFLLLEDYRDARQKMNIAISLRAKAAMEKGELDKAAQGFRAIAFDEAGRQAFCQAQYALAQQHFDNKRWQQAQQAYFEIPGYLDADEKYKQSRYHLALEYLEAGKESEAEILLLTMTERAEAQPHLYALAEKHEAAGDYLAAVRVFGALGGYLDSAARAKKGNETYFAFAEDTAKDAMRQKDYHTAVQALEKVDMSALPEEFAHLKELYGSAVYALAESLYNEGKPYEALPYYERIADYKDVKTRKLSRNAYRILGRWVSSKKQEMEFLPDGTWVFEGKTQVFSAAQYTIKTGEDAAHLKHTHTITYIKENHLTIQDVRTKKLYKMTRVR